jgi:hypothetical protein
VDVAQVTARSRSFLINGVSVEAHWDCAGGVEDEQGKPAFGATDFDRRCPERASIRLNPDLLGDRDDLWRSTALHELGHAIFDGPAWSVRASSGTASTDRLNLTPEEQEGRPSPFEGPGLNWCEWRANEFMGAFLAPRELVQKQLINHASALGLPLIGSGSDADLPILNGNRAGPDGLDAIANELAQTFGLSDSFIAVRLRKYDLVHLG